MAEYEDYEPAKFEFHGTMRLTYVNEELLAELAAAFAGPDCD